MVAPLVAMEACSGAVGLPTGPREPDFEDFPVMPDALEEEIDDWTRNQFRLYGDTYRLEWHDGADSKRIASTTFGIETK